MRSLWLFLTFISVPALAEYRAFELVITNTTTGQERVTISTLDPLQYRWYYPVKPEETVLYRATWMCRGNTSHHKAICAQPEGRNAPSTLNSGPNSAPRP